MFMSGNKTSSVKIRDKTVDLKETKDLYGRLLVLAISNRHIDQRDAIGCYEFTLTPRALFAPSGIMLPCTDKAKLIHLLVKLAEADTADQVHPQAASLQMDTGTQSSAQSQYKIIVVKLHLWMAWYLSKNLQRSLQQ